MIAVEMPNLPMRACSLILGKKYAPILELPITRLGLEPIFVPDNPQVDSRLSGHADLSVFHGGGNRLWLAPYLKGSPFARQLQDRGFSLCFPQFRQGPEYPSDAQLNQCVLGRTLIFGKRTAPKSLVDFFTNELSYQVLVVNQGYVRCSVCPVTEHALITSDRGIGEVAHSAGLDVLLISSGFVALPGFSHGFIGGAAFKISVDQLALTGHFSAHPDAKRILSFLAKHSVNPVYLTDRPIFDIGSAIPITEKEASFVF